MSLKQKLDEAAAFLDGLHEGSKHVPSDLRHSPRVRGRVEDYNQNTVALCFYGGVAEVMITLGPVSLPILAQWLRTENVCDAGDNDHVQSGCTVENCTAMTAEAFADHVLAVKAQIA